MVPDVNHAHSKLRIREQTLIGSVSYSNRYWVYRFKSYWFLFYRGKPDIMCITAGSAAVDRSHFTGRSKGVHVPSPAARLRLLIVHDRGGD